MKIPGLAASPQLLFLLFCFATEQSQAQLPFERKPIEYSKSRASDPVATLRESIQQGKLTLQDDEKFGYLLSLLKKLDIPASSQTLVFSKTSLQRHLISPANPRAIYFNDETYVAWIPSGEMIEIASTDSMLGSVFYTVEQRGGKQTGEIVRRAERCLFCHASSDSGRVPGLLMLSVHADSDGHRVFPAEPIRTNAKGPLLGRWGGWFVTGTHGAQRHLGNRMLDSTASVTMDDLAETANVVDLSPWLEVTKYLTPHSDIVALLVLQHQVTIHNLLTDANHRARERLYVAATANGAAGRREDFLSDEDLAFLDQIAERVVDGMLMIGETRFATDTSATKISGTSHFAAEFSARGPRDSMGRSLREFDLVTTLFRHPCSYLIYSESFDALPLPVLSRIYQRLLHVLTQTDGRDKYEHLSPTDRSAILQILCETKANLPAAWKRD